MFPTLRTIPQSFIFAPTGAPSERDSDVNAIVLRGVDRS